MDVPSPTPSCAAPRKSDPTRLRSNSSLSSIFTPKRPSINSDDSDSLDDPKSRPQTPQTTPSDPTRTFHRATPCSVSSPTNKPRRTPFLGSRKSANLSSSLSTPSTTTTTPTLFFPDLSFQRASPRLTSRPCTSLFFRKTTRFKNPDFTTRTPPATTFVPVAPQRVLDGWLPTTENYAQNPAFYDDVNLFARDVERWRLENTLNYLPFYATPIEVTLLACTWNVNQCVFTPHEVDVWLSSLKSSPDVVVCGLQELEMSVDAIIAGKRFSDKPQQWLKLFLDRLNRDGDTYLELGNEQLCGVMLYVFYHKRHQGFIKNIGLSSVRVGAMSGTLANKGGVAFRMQMYDSQLCFVVSHLAAHQQFEQRRNQDMNRIAQMVVEYTNVDSGKKVSAPVLDHDVVVWMGDLNYRIDLPDETVRALLAQGKWADLYRHDQLVRAREQGKAFVGFCEQHINFPPTFKIKIGEHEYKENRVPSWCDRVVYKTARRHHADVLSYTSHELYTSDHKPVSCLLSLHIRQVDEAKLGHVEEHLDLVASKYTPFVRPQVLVTPRELHFDDVYVLQKTSGTVTIHNKGHIALDCCIDDNDTYHDQWVTISNTRRRLEVFEETNTMTMTITVCFTADIAWMLGVPELLTKRIAVRLNTNTVESFTITVSPHRSVVGMRLDDLLVLDRPLLGDTPHNTYRPTPFVVPKELFRLTHAITARYVPGCFTARAAPPDAAQVQCVLSALDHDAPLPPVPVVAVVEAFLVLLQGLRTCVFGVDGLTERVSDDELHRLLFYVVTDQHRDLFMYVVVFIKRLISLGEDPMALLGLMAPVIFRVGTAANHEVFRRFLFCQMGRIKTKVSTKQL